MLFVRRMILVLHLSQLDPKTLKLKYALSMSNGRELLDKEIILWHVLEFSKECQNQQQKTAI